MSTLQELYATDPLKLTRTDIDEIIKAQRASRAQYALGNQKAGRAPAKPKTEKQKVAFALADKLKLDL